MSKKQPSGFNKHTRARIDYEPETGLWYLWEYGMQQSSTFDSIEELAAYLRDYPTQLLQVHTPGKRTE